MRWFYVIVFCSLGFSAAAEILVPVRTIRAKEIIGAKDVIRKPANLDGVISDLTEIVGQEARIALYPGRPIRRGDIGPPAIVDRNDFVVLVFSRGRLQIKADGRSLGRGSAGEIIRVMNIASRTTISGRIQSDGSIEVQ
ncbi:MAG: flagellar basal body P-ring formation protein FlgA [Rhodobacteraceae bacterium]|nr:flagellar basal body P-ring formation protein FlgA [Paracoccaceae bacterium]